MTAHPGSMALRPDQGEASETWPPQWMLDLERAHDQLRHASRLIENGAHPVIDLQHPAAAALERTFVALYDAFDERQPRLDATRAALVELDTVVRTLTPRPRAWMPSSVSPSSTWLRRERACCRRTSA